MDVKKLLFAFGICFIVGAAIGIGAGFIMFNESGSSDYTTRIKSLEKELISYRDRELKYQETFRNIIRVSTEDKDRLKSNIDRLTSNLEKSESNNKNLRKIIDSTGTIGGLAGKTNKRLERIEEILQAAGKRK